MAERMTTRSSRSEKGGRNTQLPSCLEGQCYVLRVWLSMRCDEVFSFCYELRGDGCYVRI